MIINAANCKTLTLRAIANSKKIKTLLEQIEYYASQGLGTWRINKTNKFWFSKEEIQYLKEKKDFEVEVNEDHYIIGWM